MKDDRPIQVPETPNAVKKPAQENKEAQKKKSNVKTIITVVVVAQVFLAIFAGAYFFKTGYENAKASTANTIRQKAYDTVYDLTEKANHTSNRAVIMLDGIKEKANLEVLQINTSYLYTSDSADMANNLTIWYKIPGTGTFTVDLQMTEFVVDSERHHVLVRAPLPAITKFKEEKAERLEYKDDRFLNNGSIEEGAAIGQKMLYKAHIEIMKDLEGNTEYLDAAKSSAEKLITNIIRSLNPSIKDLTVTVEYVNGK